ncbi:hypothetical protein BUALT_Bualt03G0195200 [Buddleja alternifolia]|uniref:E2 ubiquitin-conjugating enzyme n=1 Tax=Buddleja alternifolia TaxID=168488 RepID=A0AAV6XWW6_9LAMI|nr:hypothetical protein BUALT_Bualt03G0195200 [Buddleja alternifolia]
MEVEIDNLGPQDSTTPKKIKHSSEEEVIDKNAENSNSVVGSAPISPNSENLNGSNSDVSYQDDENDANDDDCDISDYDGDNDYFYDNDDDDYLSMQAQFDNVDLPPGVEASVSWLKETASNSSTSTSLDVSTKGAFPSSSSSVAASDPSLQCSMNNKNEAIAESSSSGKKKEEDGDEVARKYEVFKRFDVVDDYSDHHYSNSDFQGQQPSKEWTKNVQNEWKILEKDLPDTIYVRVYESRMDLLRAVIVGPQGTPYHDGLFVFDVYFPPTYPHVPPMVYYYSGGLRLNPNLYDCGKVCLSLLNTWTGKASEKWVPNSSTMLQVLVSIQALILNANPFFNEPGHEVRYVGEDGIKQSNAYNEEVFVLSLKTMMYTLRRPPKAVCGSCVLSECHFEDFVAGHFRCHAHDILSACQAYVDGALIGSLVNGKVPDGAKTKKCGSAALKAAVGRMISGLISNFSRHGVPDCDQFRLQKI